jgi:hypothetical protein
VIEEIPELPLLIFGQFRQFFENFMEAHFSFYQFTFLPPFRESFCLPRNWVGFQFRKRPAPGAADRSN